MGIWLLVGIFFGWARAEVAECLGISELQGNLHKTLSMNRSVVDEKDGASTVSTTFRAFQGKFALPGKSGLRNGVAIALPDGTVTVLGHFWANGGHAEFFEYEGATYRVESIGNRSFEVKLADSDEIRRARRAMKREAGNNRALTVDWGDPVVAELRERIEQLDPRCRPGKGKKAATQPVAPPPKDAPGALDATRDDAIAVDSRSQSCETCRAAVEGSIADESKTICPPGSMSPAFVKGAFCDPWPGGWKLVNPYFVYQAKAAPSGADVWPSCKMYLLKYAEKHEDRALAKAGDSNRDLVQMGATLGHFAEESCYKQLLNPPAMDTLDGWAKIAATAGDPASSYCAKLGVKRPAPRPEPKPAQPAEPTSGDEPVAEPQYYDPGARSFVMVVGQDAGESCQSLVRTQPLSACLAEEFGIKVASACSRTTNPGHLVERLQYHASHCGADFSGSTLECVSSRGMRFRLEVPGKGAFNVNDDRSCDGENPPEPPAPVEPPPPPKPSAPARPERNPGSFGPRW